MSSEKIFIIIDGHALIYRSYFAFPKQLTDSQGRLMNAVYGFARTILTAIRNFEPEYMAIAFDHKAKNFRHQVYEEYKANRPKMPDDLRPQVEIIQEVVKALGITQYQMAGYEADDLIGTISCRIDQAVDKNLKLNGTQARELLTIIVTGDQDTFQLVDDNTHVWLPGRGSKRPDMEYDAKAVAAKVGVGPEKIIDLKALMGDASDNIPGVKGIGPKTAVKLINEFGNLENLYEFLAENFGNEEIELSAKEDGNKSRKEVAKHSTLKGVLLKNLLRDRENAFLSKKLATIACAVPLEFSLGSCKVGAYDKAEAIKIFQDLDFKSLIEMLPDDHFENQVQEALF